MTRRPAKPYQEITQQALEARTDTGIMGVRGCNALDLAVFGSTTVRYDAHPTLPLIVAGHFFTKFANLRKNRDLVIPELKRFQEFSCGLRIALGQDVVSRQSRKKPNKGV